MSTKVQFRRGTTTEHSTFTGAVGEITVDTTKDTVVVHDGSTAGGAPVLREDQSNLPTSAPTTGIYNASGSLAISTNSAKRFEIDANGNVNIDSNTLYVDAVNNRVGIGTASPNSALQVNSGTNLGGILVGFNSGSSNFYDADLQVFRTGNGTERCRLDSSGRLLVGTSTSRTNVYLQVEGTNTLSSSASFTCNLATSSSGPNISLCKSRGTANNSYTVVQSGDTLGSILFYGSDGLSDVPGARISTVVDGTPGGGDMPGRLGFYTTADGAGSPTERMRISNAGTTTLTSAASTAPFIANIGASEVARIDSSGKLLVGTSSSVNTFGVAPVFQVAGGEAYQSNIAYRADAFAPFISVGHSRSATVGAQTILQSGDDFGTFAFVGSDGTGLIQGARISAQVDGTPGTNDMPGRLVFSTTADGASSPTERMKISNAGTTTLTSAASTAPFIANIGASEVARIDSSGRLLVGTSTSIAAQYSGESKVQIAGTGIYNLSSFQYSNNAFENVISLGKSRGASVGTHAVVQSGDGISTIRFEGSDGTGFITAAQIQAVVDGTPGTNDMPGRLVFSTTADGASSPTEAMRINNGQELLVGYSTDNGAYKLQVNSQIFATSATIATSDGRYKENVATLEGCVDLVKALRPVSFDWKLQKDITRIDDEGNEIVVREGHNFPDGTQVGFIAQEVQEVLADKPWLGSVIKQNVRSAVTDNDGNELAPEEEFLGIAEGNLIAVLTSALQEAISEIESLKARVAALESA